MSREKIRKWTGWLPVLRHKAPKPFTRSGNTAILQQLSIFRLRPYSRSIQGQKIFKNHNLKTGHFYFGKNRTFLFWLDSVAGRA